MTPIAAIRKRLRPGLALTVGGLAFLLTSANLFLEAKKTAEYYVASNSIEHQVAELLSGAVKTKDNPSLSESILGYRDRSEVALCVAQIQRLVGTVEAANLSALSVEDRTAVLQDKNCAFFEPKVTDRIYVTEYLVTGLLVGVAVLLLVVTWAWVGTFPHTGWRRLALVFGPVAGAMATFVAWWFEGLGPTGVAVALALTTTVVAVACLAGRIAYEWIRRGFRAEGKDEA